MSKLKEKVIQQWIGGDSRAKIASDNEIGDGTVTGIINNYKVGLENLDFEAIRQLAVEAKKHGLNLANLSSHFRLYNYFINPGQTMRK